MSEGSKSTKKKVTKKAADAVIAKKDWHLHCPPHCDVKIKEGDDVSDMDIPENLMSSLKREKVI